jgi:hypothetical protein
VSQTDTLLVRCRQPSTLHRNDHNQTSRRTIMATTGKRIEPRIPAGVVFMGTGAALIAVNPAVGGIVLGVGVILIVIGIYASRKATPPQ